MSFDAPNSMISEQAQKWEPVEGVAAPIARAVIHDDTDELIIKLIFSEVVERTQLDLQVKFARPRAYSVYEEFLHSWSNVDVPTLKGRWEGEGYSFRLLLINRSHWAASPTDQLADDSPIHYRFPTLDQIVDVLSDTPPEVFWLTGEDR